MATQNGIVKLSGKLGDLIFYKRKEKHLVKQAKKDDIPHRLSEGSKQSGKDFGEASKNARYIRKAFAPLVEKYADGYLINSLNKRLIEVFKTIPAANRGSKKLIDGNISLLKGFEFNHTTPLGNLYYGSPVVSIQPSGELSINLPKGEMDILFSMKIKGATEVCLDLMVFCFDLNGEDYEILKVNELRWNLDNPFLGGRISIPTDQNGDKALIVAMGIHYLSDSYQIYDRTTYACKITDALRLKDGVNVPFITSSVEEKPRKEDENTGLDWQIGE